MYRRVAPGIGVVVLLCCTPVARGAFVMTTNHATFVAGSTSLTVVSFDALAAGNNSLTGTEFAGQGLTIVQRDGGPINVFNPGTQNLFTTAANANSQPHVISSTLGVFYNDNAGSDNFDFAFATSPTAAGLWVGNIGGIGATTVQFLRPDNTVIAQEVFGPAPTHPGIIFGPSGGGSDNRVFIGLLADEAIGRIRVLQPGNQEGVTFDDVQWGSAAGVAAVPAPGSLVMAMIAGLTLLAYHKRNYRVIRTA
jgi:hypothetical protein